MIDKSSSIVIALCMDANSNQAQAKPLTNAEFYTLLAAIDEYNGTAGPKQLNMFSDPAKRFDFEYLLEVESDFLVQEIGLKKELADKTVALLRRVNSLVFEIEGLDGQSIKLCTIFDEGYPRRLKESLSCMPNSLREPPVLYCCGDISIAKHSFAGFVGMREISEDDAAWTRDAVWKIHQKAENENKIFGVVSGGSEGVDRISEDAAIEKKMPVIEFSKNMRVTLRESRCIDAIMNNDMLLLSEINPLRTLSRAEATAHFMNRNKFIYAISDYTVVVRSGIGANSGTWAGASEALARNISKVFVRDIDCEGNRELIKRGGIPYTDQSAACGTPSD